MVEDFCDGEKAKTHPLFVTGNTNLEIMLYFDELEICNPIGDARKKHKLGVCVCVYMCVCVCVCVHVVVVPYLLLLFLPLTSAGC